MSNIKSAQTDMRFLSTHIAVLDICNQQPRYHIEGKPEAMKIWRSVRYFTGNMKFLVFLQPFEVLVLPHFLRQHPKVATQYQGQFFWQTLDGKNLYCRAWFWILVFCKSICHLVRCSFRAWVGDKRYTKCYGLFCGKHMQMEDVQRTNCISGAGSHSNLTEMRTKKG